MARVVLDATTWVCGTGDLGFCDDIRPASRSVAANIAEGFGRYTHREFAHFLSIARASLTETENHLQHALDRRYLTPLSTNVSKT